MSHRWAALVLVLALCANTLRHAAGQTGQQPRERGAKGKLGQNYPNPFNPETNIDFAVGDEDCTGDSRQYVVTLRVINVTVVDVADFVLAGPSATSMTNVPSSLIKQPIRNMRLPCGSYRGYWDGNLRGTRKEAASGIYIAQLFVNKKVVNSMKMAIIK